MKLAGALWAFFGVVCALLIYMLLLGALSGLALLVLWGWFIVPLGVASIGLFHAMGLMLCINFVIDRQPSEEDKMKVQAVETAIPLFLGLLWRRLGTVGIVLLLGYILQALM